QLQTWGVPPDDPTADAICKRLAKLLPRLSMYDYLLLVLTVEQIAEAEKAKSEWNPKEFGDRHRRLRRAAIHAAKLAKEIRSLFSRDQKTDGLYNDLCEFAETVGLSTTRLRIIKVTSLARDLVERI